MTRVLLLPDLETVQANNGIGRVLHAQHKHLPALGIEFVSQPDRAEVIAGHTHDHGMPRLDVAHLHGLYWTGDQGSGVYTNWHREANTRIIASSRRARVLTVPSQWVAGPFLRDMRVRPRVIGHGIDLAEWTPGLSQGYVLWGKNRASDVCTPDAPWELAQRGAQVVSTFEPAGKTRPASLTVTGAMGAERMKELIRGAGVYLATTKETFGIQTIEALACGVPVLGYDHGSTGELITHKQDGYLVRPGDVDGLMAGLAYINQHRAEMSAAARAKGEQYDWPVVMTRYAELYRELASATEPEGVAVVVSCHNYGRFLGECLESVLAQTYKVDEVIVVDDGSTDDSRVIARQFASRGVRLIEQANAGVAHARNRGVAATAQPFVVCLDADDLLDPRYVESCRRAMLADRGVGLAWTGMSILRAGQRPTENRWTGPFDWEWQATPGVPPRTTIPTGAMFRRSLWERAGGYKQQYAPGEDAEFYTRGLSVGFTAKKVTEQPLYLYRDHGSGAHIKRPYIGIDTWHPWMRDKAFPLGAPSERAPEVRSYSEPKVSVIIPVGHGHAKYLPEALDSLLGQNMREWEVIVVNDSDEELSIAAYPFVQRAHWVYVAAGPGAARNQGLKIAQAPLVLFLDADDQLAPGALAAMCAAYAAQGGRYVYGDSQWMGERSPFVYPNYAPAAWLDFSTTDGKHAVTVLMATEDARHLRFDEGLPLWEDWDFFIRAALAGIHGHHVPQVTLHVRPSETGRSRAPREVSLATRAALQERYGGQMAKGCCGGNAAALLAGKLAAGSVPPESEIGLDVRRSDRGKGSAPVLDGATSANVVRMEFIGVRVGAVTYRGVEGSGREYRGGNNPVNRFANVHPADVAKLEATGQWRRIGVPLVESVETPAPEPVKAPALEGVPEPAVEAAAEPAPVLAEAGAAPEAVVQTAHGPVKRKRAAKTPKGGHSELKDLPPLDSK